MTAPTSQPDSGERPAFAHASEAEMSRILDFYGVEWRYEPTTFPILWNLDGEVVESFSPDFYLPDFDLYLEMTTLKQTLVRKKNRKLRRLRELYPDIRIKLFYARDFRAMMLKYGRLALAESLSGTPGQLVGGELTAGVMTENRVAASAAGPRPVDGGEPGASEPSPSEPAANGVVPERPGTVVMSTTGSARREPRRRRRRGRRAGATTPAQPAPRAD
ncbi:MAG TPA: hypothetical protein VFW20_08305 [Candidatus Limnocylindrales bacterium]|nr:hypothetical protein [Candidatus Limnocylindrales bacterium]